MTGPRNRLSPVKHVKAEASASIRAPHPPPQLCSIDSMAETNTRRRQRQLIIAAAALALVLSLQLATYGALMTDDPVKAQWSNSDTTTLLAFLASQRPAAGGAFPQATWDLAADALAHLPPPAKTAAQCKTRWNTVSPPTAAILPPTDRC